ncbi:MAG TPA: hypothetical protein VMW49_09030 [Candidatus Dormibacteraeota bacterium]|nr:hypothetical protein [Candidatus Dormibacteraeota bacterium]
MADELGGQAPIGLAGIRLLDARSGHLVDLGQSRPPLLLTCIRHRF